MLHHKTSALRVDELRSKQRLECDGFHTFFELPVNPEKSSTQVAVVLPSNCNFLPNYDLKTTAIQTGTYRQTSFGDTVHRSCPE